MDVKKIGYLSFGHYRDIPGSHTPTARDALLQAIQLAQEAERVGVDGAFLRVHHFAPQHSAPFPLLAAMAQATERIELGTGVIDLRYENPLYMAEEAAITDLISGGRLQLGISRGSPEPALRGWEAFGYRTPEGMSVAEMAQQKAHVFREAIRGAGVVQADPQMTGHDGALAIDPLSPGLDERLWWGSGTRASARWVGEQGFNLQSSTLLTEDTGESFDALQAEQIAIYKDAWRQAGHSGEPQVSVSRSIIPLVTDEDHRYFGVRAQAESRDQVGHLEGGLARFGRSYIGEPEKLVEELAADAAVAAADYALVTVPNQLGVGYNARLLESIVTRVAPDLGWR
ncbi:LLM class flavin-dependent oxidoreductase [Sediminivirga luteola]|uniref:LLM class flavin-dependent oxidoreductase n=1 Tax=Sediminivirga luteola TaxID=1774748 RepID=UPI00166E9686|nr:LLM class flavin-dependent oxidoreductase [Sediminivirga luteola]